MKKLHSWFVGLSNSGKIVVLSLLAVFTFGATASFAQQDSNSSIDAQTSSSTQPSPKVEVKTITSNESIPFSSTTVGDATLDQGVSRTRTIGINGVKTHYFKVTYTNNVETKRSEVKSEVAIPAVNEVIAKGTKAPAVTCANGSYVNTYGNTVCSPSSTSNGATAKCSDGTYSYSQSRRGTCSHHGGVAVWL